MKRAAKGPSYRMENSKDTGALAVSGAEAGQKLLNFLQRRISAPTGDFHRWIRTGQVRVNGARSKAFDRLSEGDMVRVVVGKETLHPMTEEHYIVYIEIDADGILMRKYLKPGDAPEACFKTDAENIVAYEMCNKHGFWQSNQ